MFFQQLHTFAKIKPQRIKQKQINYPLLIPTAQLGDGWQNNPVYLSVSSLQSLSCVWLFETPRTEEHQASLSITNSRSLLKLMSIKSVMPSSHLILCRPFLLLPSIFPSIRVFSSESVHCIRWPNYWSFSFSISPSNEYSGLISFTDTTEWLHFHFSLSCIGEGNGNPLQHSCMENPHGQRSLAGYNSWGQREL